MVRTVKDKPVAAWKSLLVIVVAGGGLLWHLLACVESPMAFSPDSKNLAFVTMEPYQEEGLLIAGTHAYRLMILSEDGKLRVVEETTNSLLTAPAYSPNGKYICYVRIPLLSAEKYTELEAYLKKKKEQQPPAAIFEWQAPFDTQVDTEDMGLPSIEETAEWLKKRETEGVDIPAVLVVREAGSDLTWSEIPFVIHGGPNLQAAYVMIRPQYSPDGQWIYFCVGDVVRAVNPVTREQRILACPVLLASLSPNGRIIAFLGEGKLGFIQTDGQKAVYRRLDVEKISLGGLLWIDNETVALLCLREKTGPFCLRHYQMDGTMTREIVLPEVTEAINDKDAILTAQVALANNGRHWVMSTLEQVFFMHVNRNIIKRFDSENKNDSLVQPVFSPDSRKVAFKHVAQEPDGYPRVDAIVFFTPEGKELTRVAVPKIDPTTTRPAPVSSQGK